jgi:Contractile injection system tube protein
MEKRPEVQKLPNVSKLTIYAFKDKQYAKEIKNGVAYSLPVNPEQMQQKLNIRYDASQGQGTQGTNPHYTGTKAQDFRIEFILDSTGALYGNTDELPVTSQVTKLLETVYFMERGIHKPRYLKLVWGAHFTFDCLLTNLDIQYTLYDAFGAPMRAKLNATFLQYIEEEYRVRTEKKESPDLTHYRQVNPADDLPLMTYEVYGNKKLYLQVAKVNNMTNFRKLKAGENIVFPPIDKPNLVKK